MVVIYSALFGKYDNLSAVKNNLRYKNFFLITNLEEFKGKKNVIYTKKKFLSNHLNNRYFKFNPKSYFKDKYVVYIDSNLEIKHNLINYLSDLVKINSTKDIILFKHPYRSNPQEELFFLFSSGHINFLKYLQIKEILKSKKNFFLFECNFIIYNLYSNNLDDFLKKIFFNVKNLIHRDQIATILSISDTKIDFRVEDIGNVRNSNYFKYYSHNKNFNLRIKINILLNRFILFFFRNLINS